MSWIAKNSLSWLQTLAIKVLKTGHVPKHVAIIMDGNRRYANKAKVEQVEGHTKGFEKLAETFQWCLEFGILEVTVYAFSIENFKRSKKEVDCLMNLTKQKLQRLLDEREKMMEYGVCVRVIGNLSLVPQDIRILMAEAMRITKHNNRAFLNVAFSYSSRDEITNAVRDVIRSVKDGDITTDDVDENLISKCLYTYKSEDPDLLIRTSGEVRFSDFLMWQTSYTCIYFTKVFWPEFNAWDLIYAVFYYQRCYSDMVKMKDDCQDNVSMLNNKTKKFIYKLYKEREILFENVSTIPMIE
ncbi:PREDICTED: dehydrodolichyl diphosphate syntase complex subunit DHDDS [Ceratosolen solmsi marchali]|uniref:Alkyl transferase n=1 Tax=Ceratosolen solmsi marchali TaxID=326594 RepID=A0AAJ7DXA7_9HYME|nr:PREDICTED: dehydrodolichyl diphosphate syntase complex subunit DHDDS [Ceratosolen solmsi marchali]